MSNWVLDPTLYISISHRCVFRGLGFGAWATKVQPHTKSIQSHFPRGSGADPLHFHFAPLLILRGCVWDLGCERTQEEKLGKQSGNLRGQGQNPIRVFWFYMRSISAGTFSSGPRANPRRLVEGRKILKSSGPLLCLRKLCEYCLFTKSLGVLSVYDSS